MSLSSHGNLNDARSAVTRARLIDAAIESLIDLGFAKTTGVEVCRRAEMTRGALNHHFPDFADLLVAALEELYRQLLDIRDDSQSGLLERATREAYARATQPAFKAVIELWMASRNDPDFARRLASAIAQGSDLFSLQSVLDAGVNHQVTEDIEPTYYTIFEALIGIGLGRVVDGGRPMRHEAMVLERLLAMARQVDRTLQKNNQFVGL